MQPGNKKQMATVSNDRTGALHSLRSGWRQGVALSRPIKLWGRARPRMMTTELRMGSSPRRFPPVRLP